MVLLRSVGPRVFLLVAVLCPICFGVMDVAAADEESAVKLQPHQEGGERSPQLFRRVTPGAQNDDQSQSARSDVRDEEISVRFQQGVAMLHAKQYEHAATALYRVLELAPKMPEAHVNMGFALLGQKHYQLAAKYFSAATDLNAYQGNAYWGLALAYENLGDLQGALGAMRTYIHLAPKGDPFVTKARSALWEWESALARGPLPEQEKQWLKQKGAAWQERNSATADSPAEAERTIEFSRVK